MKEFLYQIKSKLKEPGIYGNWSWPPLVTGKVEAEDRKAAKLLVEEDYERSFPLRVLVKDLESSEFLLTIKEIKSTDHYTRRLFELSECKCCGKPFTMIEKYAFNSPGGGFEFCSGGCYRDWNQTHSVFGENGGDSTPVIYKITNKNTGMCYVGKTRQVFTLRWYQHFFQTKGSKFHKAIRTTAVTDWIFEVVEMVIFPSELKSDEMQEFFSSREQYHIDLNDSINNGYNMVPGSKTIK